MTQSELHEPQMTALEWAIKNTLLSYVRGMKDGSVTVNAPAQEVAGGFWFPAAGATSTSDGSLRFSGGVLLSGHGGMLKLQFEDPWLIPGGLPAGPWSLTIADPYEPDARLTFATIERLSDGAATGTRLTQDGADLFFSGPYSAGTEMDDPLIVLQSSTEQSTTAQSSAAKIAPNGAPRE